jgi:hypothetical protein
MDDLDAAQIDDEPPPPEIQGDEFGLEDEVLAPLALADVGSASVAVLKLHLSARGLPVSGRKQELADMLSTHMSANPDWTPADAAWIPLTPTDTAFAETFARPESTAPEHGTLRDKLISSLPHGVGANHVPATSLCAFDHPIHFLELWMPAAWRKENLVDNTNLAVLADGYVEGKGTLAYPRAKLFTLPDVDIYLGLHILNGLAPKPELINHFAHDDGPQWHYGVPRLRSGIPHDSPWTNPDQRLRHYGRYFRCQNPTTMSTAAAKADTLHKVRPLLRVMEKSVDFVRAPAHLSGDEADCGFQGRHAQKQTIKFKREGDGFLADVLADGDGYFHVLHFRHDPVPTTHPSLSPLHNRILYMMTKIDSASTRYDDCRVLPSATTKRPTPMSSAPTPTASATANPAMVASPTAPSPPMPSPAAAAIPAATASPTAAASPAEVAASPAEAAATQTPVAAGVGKGDSWRTIWFDNLYTKLRFFSAAWDMHWKMAGVCRKNNFPEILKIPEVTAASALERVRGQVIAGAHTEKKQHLPDVVTLAICFYDSKPVHFLTTDAATIQWISMSWDVWTPAAGHHVIFYPRLNVVNDYNTLMGNIDHGDQLRVSYRYNRFTRNDIHA